MFTFVRNCREGSSRSTEFLLDWYEEVKHLEESPFMTQYQAYPTMTIKGTGEIRFILPFTSGVVHLQRLNEHSTMDVIFPGVGSTKESMLIIEALRTSECSGRVVELYNGFGERVNPNNPLSIITEAFPNSKILSRRFETDRDLNTYVEKGMHELISICDFSEAITIAKIYKASDHGIRLLLGCAWAKTPTHKGWEPDSKFNLAISANSGLQNVFDVSKFNISLLINQ